MSKGIKELKCVASFGVVKPSKILCLISDTIPSKEDMILLFIGYHSIPK